MNTQHGDCHGYSRREHMEAHSLGIHTFRWRGAWRRSSRVPPGRSWRNSPAHVGSARRNNRRKWTAGACLGGAASRTLRGASVPSPAPVRARLDRLRDSVHLGSHAGVRLPHPDSIYWLPRSSRGSTRSWTGRRSGRWRNFWTCSSRACGSSADARL